MLEYIELSNNENPHSAVIWLHGLGADGHDFVPLVKEFEALGVPPCRYLFPHAPMRAVTLNGGMQMRAWYDIIEMDFIRQEDETGVREAQAHTQAFIDREIARGIRPERIVLAGFSQGGAIALHTGLRQAQPLAGIIALSTYLPLAPLFEAQRNEASAKVPIFMAHGTADQIVPLTRGANACAQLKALNHEVQWHQYSMQHSVCAEQIKDLATFLRKALSETA